MSREQAESKKTLVLGGARSGKSAFAERQALEMGLTPFYIATGRAWDDEMVERIDIHKERRGKDWETVEEPLALADALRQTSLAGRVVLVDDLTLWITNLMMAGADVARECESLVDIIGQLPAPVIFVSNEVGLGIVPENKMAREFRDHAGLVHQSVAARCDEVWFVAAGLPLRMKPPLG